MASEDEKRSAPESESATANGGGEPELSAASDSRPVDDPTAYDDDSYSYESSTVPVAYDQPGAPPPPPPAPVGTSDDEEDEEEGMLRMSFLDHLEELRSRLIKMLMGVGVAFALSLVFANQLWYIISEPAIEALTELGIDPPKLAQITPGEFFGIVWIKLPMLTAIFLASPWVLYQVWAFIAPGLYKRERRWAGPFVLSSAGLFILGGLFAYFVAFRFGLTFLLGIGIDQRVQQVVSISSYFDLFVNVILGIGIVFELPVLIFFLSLLRIVSPRFLLQNTRYAILLIVILAAIITPTPDVFNLMIFSAPMVLLYFVGIFASYLLMLDREGKRFPWQQVLAWTVVIVVVIAAAIFLAVTRFGYKLVPVWPFLMR